MAGLRSRVRSRPSSPPPSLSCPHPLMSALAQSRASKTREPSSDWRLVLRSYRGVHTGTSTECKGITKGFGSIAAGCDAADRFSCSNRPVSSEPPGGWIAQYRGINSYQPRYRLWSAGDQRLDGLQTPVCMVSLQLRSQHVELVAKAIECRAVERRSQGGIVPACAGSLSQRERKENQATERSSPTQCCDQAYMLLSASSCAIAALVCKRDVDPAASRDHHRRPSHCAPWEPAQRHSC